MILILVCLILYFHKNNIHNIILKENCLTVVVLSTTNCLSIKIIYNIYCKLWLILMLIICITYEYKYDIMIYRTWYFIKFMWWSNIYVLYLQASTTSTCLALYLYLTLYGKKSYPQLSCLRLHLPIKLWS